MTIKVHIHGEDVLFDNVSAYEIADLGTLRILKDTKEVARFPRHEWTYVRIMRDDS